MDGHFLFLLTNKVEARTDQTFQVHTENLEGIQNSRQEIAGLGVPFVKVHDKEEVPFFQKVFADVVQVGYTKVVFTSTEAVLITLGNHI